MTHIWQVCDRSTMGNAIKCDFWGALMQMTFQCLRGYRAQNTVMSARYLCKSQLLSLRHCTSFTKLLEFLSTGVVHACIMPSHFLLPICSLKTATNNILQNLCHFRAVLLHVLSHSWKMLLGNLCTDHCQQIPGRNQCSWREGKKEESASVTKILQGRSNKLLTYFYCATTSRAIWDLQSTKWLSMKGQPYWTSLVASKLSQYLYFKVLQLFNTVVSLPPLAIISLRRKPNKFPATVHF